MAVLAIAALVTLVAGCTSDTSGSSGAVAAPRAAKADVTAAQLKAAKTYLTNRSREEIRQASKTGVVLTSDLTFVGGPSMKFEAVVLGTDGGQFALTVARGDGQAWLLAAPGNFIGYDKVPSTDTDIKVLRWGAVTSLVEPGSPTLAGMRRAGVFERKTAKSHSNGATKDAVLVRSVSGHGMAWIGLFMIKGGKLLPLTAGEPLANPGDYVQAHITEDGRAVDSLEVVQEDAVKLT